MITRCNNCMTIYSCEITACKLCATDSYLMDIKVNA